MTRLYNAVKYRYDKFVESYTTNGHNGAEAARIAGYSDKCARQTALHLLTVPYIKDRIAEIETELRLTKRATREENLKKHRELYELALKKGDYATATRNLELIGKTEALYKDVVRETSAEKIELSEAEAVEARRLANIRLMQPTG